MIFPEKIIKEAYITEKATMLSSSFNQYTFTIYPFVNRTQVKQAIEKMFNVKVARVNMVKIKGKQKRNRSKAGLYGRTSDLKKAVVSLKSGHKIELI